MIEIGNWHGETHFHIPGADGPVEVTVLESDHEYKRRKRREAHPLKLFAFKTHEQFEGVVVIAAETPEEACAWAQARIREDAAAYTRLNNKWHDDRARAREAHGGEKMTLAQHKAYLARVQELQAEFSVGYEALQWSGRGEGEFEPDAAILLVPPDEPGLVLMLPGGSE